MGERSLHYYFCVLLRIFVFFFLLFLFSCHYIKQSNKVSRFLAQKRNLLIKSKFKKIKNHNFNSCFSCLGSSGWIRLSQRNEAVNTGLEVTTFRFNINYPCPVITSWICCCDPCRFPLISRKVLRYNQDLVTNLVIPVVCNPLLSWSQ